MSKVNTRATINANIKQNGNQEITGPVLNATLNAMVTDYAEQAALDGLKEKVDALALGAFYGYFPDSNSLPTDVTTPGYAYVGSNNPYEIWNFNGESWSDSGTSIGHNDADEEDITRNADGKLQFKDRENTDGMGYVILRKDKSFAEQVTEYNTIYEIRYDFDLGGNSLTIPEGAALKFVGGSVMNGSLNLNNCLLLGNPSILTSVTGKIRNDYSTPEMFGGVGDGTNDDTDAIQRAVDSCDRIFFCNRYKSSKIYISRRNVSISGGGIFEGTIDVGWDADTFESYRGLIDRQLNFTISDIRFSKTSIIGSDDATEVGNYIRTAEFIDENKSIILHNIQGAKIDHCYFSNVPYPISVKPNQPRQVPRTINGITYDTTSVLQNVSRVMIQNCDFELCHNAVIVKSIVKDPLEYGDIDISFCNFHPTHDALVYECVDGTKIYNSVFYTGSRNTNAWNINLELCGQVLIEACSLYGEYNYGSIKMLNAGSAIINGCSFNSIGTIDGPVSLERSVAIDIVSNAPYYTDGLSITSNSFVNVKKLPIKVVGSVRGVIILDNKKDGVFLSTNYYHNISPLYYIKTTEVSFGIHLQENISDNLAYIYESIPQIAIRYKALSAMYNDFNLYEKDINTPIKVYRGDSRPGKFTLISATSYKPISVLDCTSSTGQCQLYFNGVLFNFNFTSSDVSEKIELMKTTLGAVFTDYTFENIDNLLWCVGGNNSICVAPAYSPENKIGVVWQNLGVRIKLKDADGKNFFNSLGGYPYIYSAIDTKDNGKVVTTSGGTFFMRCVANNNHNAKLNIRSREAGYSYIWTYDDFFYAAGSSGIGTNADILSKIFALAFSDTHSYSGNIITTLEADAEYGVESMSQTNRYITHDSHLANVDYIGTYSGATRPTNIPVGYMFFDTELQKPIYWTGTKWVDATGADA